MISRKELKQARLQLHQAIQLLAAVSISFMEKQQDDSHTNMLWDSNLQSLFGHNFGPQSNLKLALSFPQLTYRIYDNDLISEFDLHGKTEKQAIKWLKATLKKQGMDIAVFTMDKHYDIPTTEQSQGKEYTLSDANVFKMMSYHFNLAHNNISQLADKHKNISPVRCWPHHFDLATLITIEENQDPEKMKSVGVGLSPGDENYDQPYYYVSPWPYPDKSRLNNDDLPVDGFWHSTGFTSAILLADAYLTYQDIEKSLFNFLRQAVNISKKMVLDN